MAACDDVSSSRREFVTVSEFKDQVGVSRPTVYRMIQEGSLVAIRVGQQWRIDLGASLERLSVG